MESRLQALSVWCDNKLGKALDYTLLAGDASFRKYYRAMDGADSFVVVDAPPQQESLAAFVSVTRLLQQLEVKVPKIFHIDVQNGFMLLSDFGDTHYLDALTVDSANNLYTDAFTALVRLAAAPMTLTAALPTFDAKLLHAELGLFEVWYLNQHGQLEIPSNLTRQLHDAFDWLVESALKQPQVLVHRDFHSRNLMLLSDDNPGVIDYQDAVVGPLTYDVVSLLKDCYIKWPENMRLNWLHQFFTLLPNGLIKNVSFEDFKRYFDLMGVQRHLKAIGIFARLSHRDNKHQYLEDIPRTWSYITELLPVYPDLAPIIELGQQVISKTSNKRLSA